MREWVGWRESRRAKEERPQRLWLRGGGGLSSGRLLVSGARRLLNKVRSLAPGKAPVGRSEVVVVVVEVVKMQQHLAQPQHVHGPR